MLFLKEPQKVQATVNINMDNQPIVAMKSLAIRLLIANNNGGIFQIVPEAIGRLFKAGDYQDLSDQILYLYRNRDVLSAIKKESRKTAEDNLF